MNRILKVLFFALFIRPIVFVVMGLNIKGRKNLPGSGPAVIVANHNSHLDTMVLMSLYPLKDIHKVRPVAAADYFLRNRLLAWFSLNIIGIIPLKRSGAKSVRGLFGECREALDAGDILILFPEGSRGEPERVGELKRGVFHLIGDIENIVVTPIVMYGLGRALPKGEALFVPYNCDVVIGEALPSYGSSKLFVKELAEVYENLLEHCVTRPGSEKW